MRRILVFVGGAAGVGKTTLCGLLFQKHRGAHIKFFQSVQEEAQRRGLSKEQKLALWDILTEHALENELLSRSISPMFIDTHYSFQRRGGVVIAFAKRGFSPLVVSDATYCAGFVNQLSRSSVLVIAVLKSAPEEEIRRRQLCSGGNVLTVDVISLEQRAEQQAWEKFTDQLCTLGVACRSFLLNGVYPIQVEVDRFSSEFGKELVRG